MQKLLLVIGLLFVIIGFSGCDSSHTSRNPVYRSAEKHCSEHGGTDIVTFYTKRDYVTAWCSNHTMIQLDKSTGIRLQ